MQEGLNSLSKKRLEEIAGKSLEPVTPEAARKALGPVDPPEIPYGDRDILPGVEFTGNYEDFKPFAERLRKPWTEEELIQIRTETDERIKKAYRESEETIRKAVKAVADAILYKSEEFEPEEPLKFLDRLSSSRRDEHAWNKKDKEEERGKREKFDLGQFENQWILAALKKERWVAIVEANALSWKKIEARKRRQSQLADEFERSAVEASANAVWKDSRSLDSVKDAVVGVSIYGGGYDEQNSRFNPRDLRAGVVNFGPYFQNYGQIVRYRLELDSNHPSAEGFAYGPDIAVAINEGGHAKKLLEVLVSPGDLEFLSGILGGLPEELKVVLEHEKSSK
ncbi:MAG: hypothetical protein U9O78_03735 [Patescibacteria group bacterium]|nr:hypothetical protein [Patescibacteria group bacterium]